MVTNAKCEPMKCNEIHNYNTIQWCNTIQYNIYNTMEYNKIQYNNKQYSTTLYNLKKTI